MTEDDGDVERVWKEFWEEIVCPNGILDLEQVKKELYDFRMMMTEAGKAYYHVTGGRLSKPNTASYHIIDAYEESIETMKKTLLDDMGDE
jgi:hypothetical protein